MAMGAKSFTPNRFGRNTTVKTKTSKTIARALILALALSSLAAVSCASAVDSGESSTNTSSTINISPNPAFKGSAVLIQMQIYPLPPQAPESDPTHYWHGLTLKITKPDGNLETKDGLFSDNAGELNYTYYPSVAGIYKIEFFFPKQTLTFVNLGVPMYIPYIINYLQSNSTTQLIVLSPELKTNPSAPEFTVRFLDNSYEIPVTTRTVSTTDPYTNKTTTSTLTDLGGYYVNQTIELIIKNQPFALTFESSKLALYYSLRFKPHFGENWAEQYNETAQIGVLHPNSNSEYTIISLPGDYTALAGGQVDYQVEALSAYTYTSYEYMENLPSSYSGPFPVPINHTVFVGSSGWSSTQTLAIPETAASPTPELALTPAPPTTRTPSPILTQSPTQQPTIEPSTTPNLPQENLTSVAVIVGAGIAIAVVIGLIAYSTKHRGRKR